jgi:hypothetical protein
MGTNAGVRNNSGLASVACIIVALTSLRGEEVSGIMCVSKVG